MTSQIDIDCRHYGDCELGTARLVDINDHWETTLLLYFTSPRVLIGNFWVEGKNMKPLRDIAKPQDYPVFRFSDKTIPLLDHRVLSLGIDRKTYRARIGNRVTYCLSLFPFCFHCVCTLYMVLN